MTYNIPKTRSKTGLGMVPEYIVKNIDDIFKDINLYIKSEKDIYLENNNNNEYIRFSYYCDAYELIYEKFMYFIFNKFLFWEKNMNHRICDYKYKNGKYAGMFCGRIIDIKCTDENGMWRCSKHISSKYHKPKPLNVPIEERCISLCKNGERCKFRKKYFKYCKFHYSIEYNINVNIVDEHYIETNKKIIFENNIKEIVKKSFNINSLYNIINKNDNIVEKVNKYAEQNDFLENKLNRKNIDIDYHFNQKDSILTKDGKLSVLDRKSVV